MTNVVNVTADNDFCKCGHVRANHIAEFAACQVRKRDGTMCGCRRFTWDSIATLNGGPVKQRPRETVPDVEPTWSPVEDSDVDQLKHVAQDSTPPVIDRAADPLRIHDEEKKDLPF